MSRGGRLSQLRRTGFIRTLRASLLELLDELLAFCGFLVALLAGLYYGSWWIFGGVLLVAFLVGGLIRWVMASSRSQ